MRNISVIIVSYYTGPALWLAIDSVLSQPECKELFIVNNGNAPGEVNRLNAIKQQEPRVIVFSGHGNIGFGKACNLAAKSATGDYILLLNPDSMLPEGGLSKALAEMEKQPDNTLAGCFLAYPDGTEQRGGRRALLTPQSGMVESLGLQTVFKRSGRLNFHETPMPEDTHEVPAISGAFMLTTRNFYNEMGGIDEGYFLHMEDMDLCYRVHKAGGKIICMPSVKVIHFRSTSEVSSAFIEKCKAKGFIRYLHLHFKDRYPSLFLFIMSVGIWARCVIKIVLGWVDNLFANPMQSWYEIARIVLLYRLSFFDHNDSSLKGKTIIITGASGQVGLSALGKALARGAQVIAVSHTTHIAFTHPHLTWMYCDLTNPESAFDTIKADILIHTAALWLLPPALPRLLETGVERVVAFSSTSVIGKSDSENKHEQEIVEKLMKAEQETLRMCAEAKKAVTLLRPTMIYGVGLDGNITRLANVIRRFGAVPVYGKAEGWRHPVQAQDLADASLSILDNPRTFGKTYNLGGTQTMKYRTMVMMLFDYLGKAPNLIQVPFMPKILDALGNVYQASHINGEMARRMNQDLLFDIKDAVEDFGYKPHGFLQGDMII